MKILAIETSCDETAVAVVEAEGGEARTGAARFRVLGNALLSQVEKHAEYGGVFPALAKREHAKNLVPLLEAALEEAELLHESEQEIPEELRASLNDLLAREGELAEDLFEFLKECEQPALDAIAVTAGPGLEPALWVGINFAKALANAWDLPVVAVNHMEGHIMAGLTRFDLGANSEGRTLEIPAPQMPVLALLISGGHTELVLMKEWPRRTQGGRGPDRSVGTQYELIGQTRDDAVGEAFDKVARMLALPYPGGPQISKLAEAMRATRSNLEADSEGSTLLPPLPRPMINDASCDFSFAGLKTAVLYLLKNREVAANAGEIPGNSGMIYHTSLSEQEKSAIALEFENAVGDVLWKKTARALEQPGAKTLVIGGGVSANTHIRRVFKENIENEFPEVALRIPEASLTTDNAVMIALAGYYRALRSDFADPATLSANGNLSLV